VHVHTHVHTHTHTHTHTEEYLSISFAGSYGEEHRWVDGSVVGCLFDLTDSPSLGFTLDGQDTGIAFDSHVKTLMQKPNLFWYVVKFRFSPCIHALTWL
jgi:hypothetical protein